MSVSYDSVAKGTELPARSYQVTRLDLVKYAGASGDFNVIHWNERVARSVGLPDVIAHGMYTMAQAGKFVTEWAGDPGAVTDFGVRFSAMVPVPDDTPLSGNTGGATIEMTGKVLEKLGDNKVTVDIVARASGTKVLSRARATVRLS
ncbi:MAG TPA: MaoC family dehydratase [Trebonia sp.]|jgi:hydroxyacyl-ACP dehydratase HTD2-like protein with hotdog domain|nr:MaoC family dehydratase [Trebonia sp.]